MLCKKLMLVATFALLMTGFVTSYAEETVSSFTGDQDFATTAIVSGVPEKLLVKEPGSKLPNFAPISEPSFWNLIGTPSRVLLIAAALSGLAFVTFRMARWVFVRAAESRVTSSHSAVISS
jgi:hypothetical protein